MESLIIVKILYHKHTLIHFDHLFINENLGWGDDAFGSRQGRYLRSKSVYKDIYIYLSLNVTDNTQTYNLSLPLIWDSWHITSLLNCF